jgi:hypothetical protein
VLIKQNYDAVYKIKVRNEVSTNFCGQTLSRDQSNGSLRLHFLLSRPEPLLIPNIYKKKVV